MNKTNKMMACRHGNLIPRNQTTPTIDKDYTVGVHSMAMCQIALIYFPGRTTKKVLEWIIMHDAASEFLTGDIYGPAKYRFPELGAVVKLVEQKINQDMQLLPDLTEDESKFCHYIDNLELVIWAIEENLGRGCWEPKMMRIINILEPRLREKAADMGFEQTHLEIVQGVREYYEKGNGDYSDW